MDTAINFYELKTELAGLGFTDPRLANELRTAMISDKTWFGLDCIVDAGNGQVQFQLDFSKAYMGNFSLETYNGIIAANADHGVSGIDHLRDQAFEPDVPVAEAVLLLQDRLERPEVSAAVACTPMTRQEVRASLGLPLNEPQKMESLNKKTMNEQNLDFLKDNLKYLGFEDKLNKELESKISKQPAEFTLQTEIQHYNNKTDHTLHFKKSSETDMYFLNKHDATLKNGKPEDDKTQGFYITKGHGVTAKEAFNLLEGRSVYKELVNKEKEPYKAWLKIDFSSEKDDKTNNYKVKQFSEGYGYDLENSLSRFPIKELADTEQKETLLKSLQKGNLQQITVDKDNKPTKFFIEASPQFKTINVFSDQHKTVKREVLLKQDNKNDQSKGKGKNKGRGKGL